MDEKIIRPERRHLERRQGRLASLRHAVEESSWSERRIHCWDLESDCTEIRRKRCAAYFVRRNCWDLWAAEYFPPGRKPCCHRDLDCSACPVAAAKFSGPVSVYVPVPTKGDSSQPAAATNHTLTYCPSLYSIKEPSATKGDPEVRTVFRCQRRPGIQLHSTYVSEVCGSPDHRECTFCDTE